jgi:hypothetical protein
MVPDMTGVTMYFGGDDAPDYSPDDAPQASSAEFNKDMLLAEVGLLGDGVQISEDGSTASRTAPAVLSHASARRSRRCGSRLTLLKAAGFGGSVLRPDSVLFSGAPARSRKQILHSG